MNSDAIFFAIREWLNENSEYNPEVAERADTDNFPKVVVNSRMERPNWQANVYMNRELVESYTLFVDIYAKDKPLVSATEIADEIQGCLYELLTKKLNLRITQCTNVPNIDESVLRRTMKYTYYI